MVLVNGESFTRPIRNGGHHSLPFFVCSVKGDGRVQPVLEKNTGGRDRCRDFEKR